MNLVVMVGTVKGSAKRLNPQVVSLSLSVEEPGETALVIRCICQREAADVAEAARDGDFLAITGRLRAFTINTGPTTKASELQVVCSKVVNLSQEVEKSQLGGQ